MSRDRYRAQEDWDDEEDGAFDPYNQSGDYEEEEEYHKPGRRRRRRRGSWSCLFMGCAGGIVFTVLLIVAVIFVAAGTGSTQIPHFVPALPVPGGSVGGSSTTSMYMQQSQQAVQLSTIVQMQIHNQVGDISIAVDAGATAPTVTMIKKVQAGSQAAAQDEFRRISVQVQADSTTNTLVVGVILPGANGDMLRKDADAVDVVITLPPGVVANTRAGASPAPTLVLNADTSVGNVVLNGLNGVLVVKDSFGNVTVHNATLAGGSHLETGIGNVVFDGALSQMVTANAQPMYKLQAEKGNVEVTLPAMTNVTLDANVNVGSITSEFPITISSSAGSPSYYGPLMSGTTPAAVLVLDVSSGNIDLHKD